ncbi:MULTISPECIES: molybdopterin molybdotransferase MoeA [unclassified Leifsonia]|uniref:molybdopterin molybdotransferase MoeA n=1 Tax=unclassified Leifsonia TaxID=2663824 RepID=UPI0006FA346E|nr:MULTISPECIES: gephyrin-like molybdotransferase Glp [unclassified Leifsonia]KQX05602.1 molybdenum cofactor biosynthesis protein MoeA [Leifsonia sp. Root1293]KRA09236.1 molybdenum cofactor biosynthesis protein MoeA [Leifsonia sp. Root60]
MGERIPVEEHVERVAELLAPLRDRGAAETLPLLDARGRATAGAIRSAIDLPPFRNSQMDGFAVRSAEVVGAPVALPVVGEVAAAPGEPPTLEPGTTTRIMTGAPIPAGADAVVPVEDTSVDGASVTILRARERGEYVREAGSDLRAGAELLGAGVLLESRHLAALAASGLTEVAVRSRVRVAVVSTGSELVAPGEALGSGQIPDSNGIALQAAVTAAGAVVVSAARVRDDAAELRARFDAAIDAGAELLLTSGGVSMGEHEVVRDLLEPLGAWVGAVAMQPGGPQATASYRGLPVICFPGNPVSSQLSFALFVAPVLREIAGLPVAFREHRTLAASVTSIVGRRQYLRGRRMRDGRVELVGGPGSHLVAALAAADVLVIVPEAVAALAAGDLVEVLEL